MTNVGWDSIAEADNRAKHAEEYTARREKYSQFKKRLSESRVGATIEARLALEICEFLLDTVEFRKIY